MKLNPLAVFTGLTLATFGALVYVERNTGSEEALTATAKVEPLAVPEPPKPAEPVVAAACSRHLLPWLSQRLRPSRKWQRWKNRHWLSRQSPPNPYASQRSLRQPPNPLKKPQ